MQTFVSCLPISGGKFAAISCNNYTVQKHLQSTLVAYYYSKLAVVLRIIKECFTHLGVAHLLFPLFPLRLRHTKLHLSLLHNGLLVLLTLVGLLGVNFGRITGELAGLGGLNWGAFPDMGVDTVGCMCVCVVCDF